MNITSSKLPGLFGRALLCTIFIGAAASSRAELIIDTGPGVSYSAGSSLYTTGADHQWIAGQFTLDHAAVVTDIQGWMGVVTGGSVKIQITSNSSGIPDTPLFEDVFSSSTNFHNSWLGITGETWLLNPGIYWATFIPVDGFYGYMPNNPGVLLHPLADYSINYTANRGIWLNDYDFGQIGLRVFGDSVINAVPESSTYGIAGMTVLIGAIAWRRRKSGKMPRAV